MARNNSGNYSYEYNLTDHLGNVRYTFNKHPTTGAIQTLQIDNYYAFGLRKSATGGTNKYLYNGKELQEELGQYDYGARFYDPTVGRWNVVDPMAEATVYQNPYSYGNNNPAVMVDPDGMLARYNWETGEYEDENGQPVHWQYALNQVKGDEVDPTKPWLSLMHYAVEKIQSGFGLRTAIDGAVEKASNVAEQEDSSYQAHVPAKTRAVRARVRDQAATNKMIEGMTEVGGTTFGAAGLALSGLEGALARHLFVRAASAGANLGKKLDYVFGKATGNAHNIERSTEMLRQLQSVGIFDNATGRFLLNSHLESAYRGAQPILQSNGRYLRESLLMGPRGGLKVQSVWDGNKLITIKLIGGK